MADAAPRVLVVEDQWLIAETIAEDLKAGGFAVVGPAFSVAEGCKMVDAHAIDVGVLDIDLNGEKSFPLAEALAERNVPFVFLSGYGLPDLPQRFRSAPHLSKPVSATALHDTIGKLIGKASRA